MPERRLEFQKKCKNVTATYGLMNRQSAMYEKLKGRSWMTLQNAPAVMAVHTVCIQGDRMPRNQRLLRAASIEFSDSKKMLNAYPADSNAAKPAPTAAPRQSPLSVHGYFCRDVRKMTAASLPGSSMRAATEAPIQPIGKKSLIQKPVRENTSPKMPPHVNIRRIMYKEIFAQRLHSKKNIAVAIGPANEPIRIIPCMSIGLGGLGKIL